MFYLTMHSTHFIYGRRKEEMFYSWLYGVRHMVKDYSDSERGNPLPLHRLLFLISSKGSFIYTYYSLCYTRRGTLAGLRNSPMGPP